jgi:hypothetical protein
LALPFEARRGPCGSARLPLERLRASIDFVSLAEALELTLLPADEELEKYERAAPRWHVRFVEETPNVDVRQGQAVLALLSRFPRSGWAAAALAELLSRRRSRKRITEALVR